jgi:hypothetical protein
MTIAIDGKARAVPEQETDPFNCKYRHLTD